MTTIKRHWLLILLTVALISALALVCYRCSHHAAGGSLVPANSASPASGTSTTLTSLLTDPTTLGAIITAVASALGLLWKALQKRDVQGVVAAVSQGVTSIENLKDTLRAGGSMTPSAETLGDDLVVFTLGTSGLRTLGGIALHQATFELAMRVTATKLLAKYSITVKP